MTDVSGQSALAGVSVVEFGEGIAVGYCGALLAACGADVIKIEPPGTGDAARRLPPFAEGVPAPEAGGMHAFLSAGKRGVAIDLAEPAGRALAVRLAERSDVVLEAMGPGVADGLGLGHDALKAGNPRLIMTALSWFGADGARRDWAGSDAIVQALAGFIYPIGAREGPPIIPGGYQAQINGGLTAFIATLGALIGGLRGEAGTLIEQSILEAQLAYTETAGGRFAYDGVASTRKGINKIPPTYPQTIYPAQDGWIGVTALTPVQWRACCEMIGAPELIDDPRFRVANDRYQRADELDPYLIPLFRQRPAREWFHEGQKRRVPMALVPTMAELANLDQFRAREVFGRFEHPELGAFDAPAIPWKLARTPLQRGGRAPRLGEHTEEVLAQEGALPAGGASGPGERLGRGAPRPLEGNRVVDLTMGWSGPLATRHLADLGAEVIKIESCIYPDWWRGWEFTAESVAAGEHERHPGFNQLNRNKYGVTIDLTRQEGRDLALRLVARADAVIENQASGVLAKLGLSYEELKGANPEIILLSMPAFGAEGPWSGYRGYGSTVEHAAGLPHLTGDADGPPIQSHVAYGDACGGLNAAAALLVGLFHRRRTGQGQRIDISQTEAMMQLGVHGMIAQGLNGAPPERTGNRHPLFAPHGCYAAAGPDSWLVVAVTEDAQWPALCAVIGRPDLRDDPTLATAAGRRVRAAEIDAAIAAWAAAIDADEAMGMLQAAGVAAATALRPSDLLSDPALLERGCWPELDRAIVGRKPLPATPWRYDGRRGLLNWPAPLLGEHNEAVFCGILGLEAAELAALEQAGVIGDRPVESVKASAT